MRPFSGNPFPAAAFGAILLCFAAAAQDVGAGAPTEGIKQRFVNAYYRGSFANLVSLPANSEVHRLGATVGLVQEFSDVAKTKGVTYALVRANASTVVTEGVNDVLQMLPELYAFYSAQGVTTVGFPTTDSLPCTAPAGASGCTYQYFDKNYLLFAYKSSNGAAQNAAVRNSFYTVWNAGGINSYGPAIDIERSVTGPSSVTATAQDFLTGSIYAITSGTQSGSTFGVSGTIYGYYTTNGGYAGGLGLPTSDEVAIAEGRKRQTFQGGTIEYLPGSTDAPVLRLPVNSVSLAGAATAGVLRLNLGDSATVSALLLASDGSTLTDRAVNWTTSNGRVVTIQANALTAVLKAVGGGTASVAASSEGKASAALQVLVTAPCCRVGEGAPTPVVEQAFLDAVARNKLNVVLPAANAVRRSGAGYVQELQGAAAPPVRYLIAKPDRLSTAYLLSGEILRRYEELGGPQGALGHPVSDASAGGRQLFENAAALAGAPARLVSGVLLAKWQSQGYETGAAGLPGEEAALFLTYNSTAGASQVFRNGAIYGITAGARTGQAYFVHGPILERYRALGAAAGVFGAPLSDEFVSGGLRRQNFEGGYFDYALGQAAAEAHENARRPAVSATPAAVVAGGRVRFNVSGFNPGASLRVSITGQPDFVVRTANGAYAWDAYVPLTAATATITVRSADVSGTNAAQTTYRVRSVAEGRPQLAKLRGDAQTGAPASQLPVPLRIVLRDELGTPMAGAAVAFRASAGAQIAPAAAVTDGSGEAEALLRLPAYEGVALATVESSGAVATFTARAAQASLINFPKLTQAADGALGNGPAPIARKGAFLAAAASILRYHQSRAELPSPNGLADVAALNKFLTEFCAVDPQGARFCDGYLANADTSGDAVLNPWRLASFAGGGLDISVESPEVAAVRDLVSRGSPVLLVLSLARDGAPAGGHAVVATGVAGDGGILIHDPSPGFARSSLNEYLAGFAKGEVRKWSASLAGVLRLLPRAPAANAFLISSASQAGGAPPSVASGAGPCSRPLSIPDLAAAEDGAPAAPPAVSFFLACDGSERAYQLTASAGFPFTVTDLSTANARETKTPAQSTAYMVSRPAVRLELANLSTAFAANAVVNAATFGSGIAPGGLMAIFGSGLSGPGAATSIEVNGAAARVLAATPFQVNAEVPAALAPGTYPMRIQSAFGSAEQPVAVAEAAPGIFLVGGPGVGAVVNGDGKLNAPTVPARRGQVVTIYGTGFGAVNRQGALSVTRNPVVALVNGQELPVSFAGLTPGFVGLYQVNLQLPQAMAPGLELPLAVRQAGVDSNTVFLSVQ